MAVEQKVHEKVGAGLKKQINIIIFILVLLPVCSQIHVQSHSFLLFQLLLHHPQREKVCRENTINSRSPFIKSHLMKEISKLSKQ